MEITKVLNNNAAIVKGFDGKEQIVLGKGIAFGAKPGHRVDAARVEKVFSIESSLSNRFEQLLGSIPLNHVLLSERAIAAARIALGKKLNDCIYITLTDHISAAIQRYQEGIVLTNPLLWDVRRFYPDEYAVSLQVNQIVLEETGIAFTDHEAAFIAMHFVNAQLGGEMNSVYNVTRTMQEICTIVKKYYKIEFDEESLAYYRFITHIKFLSQRLQTGQRYGDDVDDLLHVVRYKHHKAYACALRIKQFLNEEHDYDIGDEELLYLTIHIARISK